jgi:nicotinamide N-methyltransferase
MMITLVQFKKPSFLKCLSSFGAACRIPKLTPTKQHTQLSIRKRATAFVDAHDDLKTKIGCLSRHLNFLMTEADLWQDKFAMFKQYAERLSAEAGQLRSRIGKEQTRQRLSDLVHLIAAEKAKLQTHKHRLRTPHSNTNNAL